MTHIQCQHESDGECAFLCLGTVQATWQRAEGGRLGKLKNKSWEERKTFDSVEIVWFVWKGILMEIICMAIWYLVFGLFWDFKNVLIALLQ